MSSKPNIMILGGGFAGLETAFYLRYRLGQDLDLTLVSDHDYFLFKPNTIYIPFGQDPEKFLLSLDRPTHRQGIRFLHGRVDAIDPAGKTVLMDGRSHPYDQLVLATGAAMRPEEIPGLKEHALAIWTPDGMLELRRRLAEMVDRAKTGQTQKLVFLVPPNNRCSGPLYELVMMIDTWLRRQKVRDPMDITWTTMEEGYIQAFGPRLNTVVTDEFEERGIHGHKGLVVTAVEPGLVHFQSGEQIPYDLLVTFPPYIAGQHYETLPTDERGFVHVEPDSRQVMGQPDIYAVGDIADFPIKQAFLALLQADAAGEHLAARIRGEEPQFQFEPMSMCVMEELNKATFAQVPLKYTGDPLKPVAVDEANVQAYKVGISPLWRIGKAALGIYAPWRFGGGKPFHAGFAWGAMDMGLKVISKLLAT